MKVISMFFLSFASILQLMAPFPTMIAALNQLVTVFYSSFTTIWSAIATLNQLNAAFESSYAAY